MSKNIDGVVALKNIDNQTLYQTIQTEVQQEIEDAANSGVITELSIADGLVSAPSLNFLNETGTGLYRPGTGILGLSTSGSERLRCSTTGASVTGVLSVSNGATVPTSITALSTAGSGTVTATSLFVAQTLNNGRANGFAGTSTNNPTNGYFFGQRYQNGSAITQLTLQSSSTAFNISTAGGNTTGIDRLLIGMDTGQFQFLLGSAATPTISYQGDTNTGIYSSAADNLDFSTNGVNRLNINNTAIIPTIPIRGSTGSVSAPSFSFSASNSTGLYSPTTNQYGLSANGTLTLTGTSTSLLPAVQIQNQLGSATTPSYSFLNDPNTGIYSSGPENINFSTNGTNKLNISNTAISTNLPLYLPVGSESSPSFSFNGDSSLGMYSSAPDTLDFTAAGDKQMTISPSGVSFTNLPGITLSKLIVPISTTAQSLNASVQTVNWSSPSTNIGSDLSYSSNVITVNTTGIYLISYNISGGTGNNTSTILLWLDINNSGNVDGMFLTNYFTGASNSWGMSNTSIFSLSATNTLRIKVNNVANTPAINNVNGGVWCVIRLL